MLSARTPKDCTFVLVTPDILEMDMAAQVFMRFFCDHFHQKEKHYHRFKTCFTSIPCIKKEMSVLRPEDNVDNDTIVLNKHSVVKKSQLGKGDLMDGLTGQNNRFKLAGNQEKI